MSPLSRLLAGLVTVLAMVGAFFFGLFIFAIVIALAIFAWAAFSLRVWWLRRQLEKAGLDPLGGTPTGTADRREGATGGGSVIDAEYEVVSRKEDD